MGVIEILSLTAVLLLALYGAAQAALRIGEQICRPRVPRVMLVLSLEECMPDAEHHIRYAQMIAKQYRLRLVLDGCDIDSDNCRIARVLLESGVGEWAEMKHNG